MSRKRKRASWSVREKLSAIESVEKEGLGAVATRIGASKSTVSDWKSKRAKLESTSPEKRRVQGGGRKPRNQVIDINTYRHVVEKRLQGCPVNGPSVQAQAKCEAKHQGDSDFKASAGWLAGWKRRHHLASRRVTGLVKKMPSAKAASIQDFRANMVSITSSLGENIPIWNFDETPVYYDLSSKTTLDAVGTKKVLVRKCGSTNKRCSVGLTVISTGEKVIPFVIFKGKARKASVTEKMVTTFQEKAFMDTATFRQLVDNVIIPAKKLRPGPAILIMDEHPSHTDQKSVKSLKAHGFRIVMIPGGTTAYLQPLDVAVNKSFKNSIRKQYETWLETKGIFDLTPHGNPRAPKGSLVSTWMTTGWDTLMPEQIISSFRAAGSNSADENSDQICLAASPSLQPGSCDMDIVPNVDSELSFEEIRAQHQQSRLRAI